VFFEGLDLGAKTLVCKNGEKQECGQTVFEKTGANDAEIYQIRGYKPKQL
jgi:hypothetical protein